MRWLSPDGLSIFWISFQGECLVMTREKETNIIMCCQSPLKMGLMTGGASRTHTQPDSCCRHLCVCSFMGMRVCKIKYATYLHPHGITDTKITHKVISARGNLPMNNYCNNVPIWGDYCFSYWAQLLHPVHKLLSMTFMLPLCSSKPDLLGSLAHSNLPIFYPVDKSSQYLQIQSGEAVKIRAQDIFTSSQNRVVAFWSICYYRMSQRRHAYQACP